MQWNIWWNVPDLSKWAAIHLDATGANRTDTLRCSTERSRPLAELVYEKTAGNPFFVKALLLTWCDTPRGKETSRKRRARSGGSITAWIGPCLRGWRWCSGRFGKSPRAQRFRAWSRSLCAEKGTSV